MCIYQCRKNTNITQPNHHCIPLLLFMRCIE
nr:MAG TPA_asm: hypothetical protein [Bacteriophage sp.]